MNGFERVRSALAHERALGNPFASAWTAALSELERGVSRYDDAAGELAALLSTREAWESAYDRAGSAPGWHELGHVPEDPGADFIERAELLG